MPVAAALVLSLGLMLGVSAEEEEALLDGALLELLSSLPPHADAVRARVSAVTARPARVRFLDMTSSLS
jgi:hypothetical protein